MTVFRYNKDNLFYTIEISKGKRYGQLTVKPFLHRKYLNDQNLDNYSPVFETNCRTLWQEVLW